MRSQRVREYFPRQFFYNPQLRPIAGSVTATILLQEMMSMDKARKGNPFYRFKEPCNHSLYEEGKSWTEYLGFSPEEFDTAIKKIGVKTTKANANEAHADDTIMVSYWTDLERVTWYWVNIDAIANKIDRLFGGLE